MGIFFLRDFPGNYAEFLANQRETLILLSYNSDCEGLKASSTPSGKLQIPVCGVKPSSQCTTTLSSCLWKLVRQKKGSQDASLSVSLPWALKSPLRPPEERRIVLALPPNASTVDPHGTPPPPRWCRWDLWFTLCKGVNLIDHAFFLEIFSSLGFWEPLLCWFSSYHRLLPLNLLRWIPPFFLTFMIWRSTLGPLFSPSSPRPW